LLFYAAPVEHGRARNGEGHHDDEVNHTPPSPTQPTTSLFYGEPVEYGGASNGEGHHDDEVGEKGERAEDQVGHLPKPCFDHL
jgi:hypothetical protein